MASFASSSTPLSKYAGPATNPTCRTCKSTLTQEDKQKTTDKYWKSYKACRNKVTSKKRKSKLSSSSTAPEASHSDEKKPKLNIDGQQQAGLPPNFSRTFSLASSVFKNDSSFSESGESSQEQEQNTTTATSKVMEQKPTERECSACADSFLSRDFPGLMTCEHIPDVCHECFLTWLDQEMASTTWERVQCPTSGCNNPITHEDVRKYASVNTFNRFDELSMRSFLSNQPNFLYCLAEGFTSGQLHDDVVEGNIFRCTACRFRMCTAHDPIIPFHENETCLQHNERLEREAAERLAMHEETERLKQEQEEASAAKVKLSSVECPGCGSNIEKTDGCDHMTCLRVGCNYEFCYSCRAPYRGSDGIWGRGNSAHDPECRHHSSRLPSYEEPPLDIPNAIPNFFEPLPDNIPPPALPSVVYFYDSDDENH